MGMASRGGYSREDPVAQNAIKAVGLHLAITEPYCLSVHTAWLPCGEWRLPVSGGCLSLDRLCSGARLQGVDAQPSLPSKADVCNLRTDPPWLYLLGLQWGGRDTGGLTLCTSPPTTL